MNAITIDSSELNLDSVSPRLLDALNTSRPSSDGSASLNPQLSLASIVQGTDALAETETNGVPENPADPDICRPFKQTHKPAPRRRFRLFNEASSWLNDDPFQWRGKKVRNRKTHVVYTIRQVFHSGWVEPEKSWIVQMTNVNTVRKDCEPDI